jgi:hypothetical protein
MKNSRCCIVSIRSTLIVQLMCDKRRQKKMYFPKVNIYHDQLYEDKRKTSTNKSRVCAYQKKRSISLIWKQKENVDQKNTIVQMKEKKKKLVLKIETSYT